MKKTLMILSLAAWAFGVDLNSIPANIWVKLDNIQYQFPTGYTGAFNLRFWCDFTWDPDSQRILFYEGYLGAPNNTYGSIYANAVYALTPADAKIKLLNLTNWTSTGYDAYSPGSGQASPHPRHTYGGFLYVPNYKNIYMGFGACAHDPNCVNDDFWKYRPATDTWTKATAPLPDAQLGGYETRFAHLPGSDTLWAFSPRRDASTWLNIYAFNLKAESWSQPLNYGSNTSALSHVAEDPVRKRILVLTNHQGTAHFYSFDPVACKLIALANPPAGLSGASVMTYVSKYDQFLVYSVVNKTLWVFDPAGSSWKEITPPSLPGARIDGYIAYDPVNDVVATYDINNEFHVFRYVPAGSGIISRPLAGTKIGPTAQGKLVYFSLSGRRVSGALTNGLYIVRQEGVGKKVMVLR